MLMVVVNNGVLVEVRCILHEPDESKLLREKEDYVILDLSHYHNCKPTSWLNGFGHGISQQLTAKKEDKLSTR